MPVINAMPLSPAQGLSIRCRLLLKWDVAEAIPPPNGWCTVKNGKEIPTKATDPNRSLCTADITCAVMKAAAKADGLKEQDCKKACPKGSYKKALVLDPLTQAEKGDLKSDIFQTDYHWLRQDSAGTWSHKPGTGPATDRAPGNLQGTGKGGKITDPQDTKARRKYTTFCGCFCCGPRVKKASLFPDGFLLALAEELFSQDQPAVAVSDSGLVITAILFSGRTNPQWILTDPAALDTLAAMLENLPETNDPDWAILGEGGFLIHSEDIDLLAGYGLLPGTRIYEGIIRFGTAYYEDIHGLEQWLRQNWPDSERPWEN